MLFANQVEDKERKRTYVVMMVSRLGLALRLAFRHLFAPAIRPAPSVVRAKPKRFRPFEKSENRLLDRIQRYRKERRHQTLRVPPVPDEEITFCVDYFLDAATEADKTGQRSLADMYRELAMEFLSKGPKSPDPSGALAMPIPREYIRVDARGSVA
jgi:hypothetical protein